MLNRLRPRLSLSLNGLSARRLAIQTWKRMEGPRCRHDLGVRHRLLLALFATVPLLALFLVVTVSVVPRVRGHHEGLR